MTWLGANIGGEPLLDSDFPRFRRQEALAGGFLVPAGGGTVDRIDCLVADTLGGTIEFRLGLYAGGTASDPSGATLLWDSGEVEVPTGGNGSYRQVEVAVPSIAVAAGQHWIVWKCNNGPDRVAAAIPADDPPPFSWTALARNLPMNESETVAFEAAIPGSGSPDDIHESYALRVRLAEGNGTAPALDADAVLITAGLVAGVYRQRHGLSAVGPGLAAGMSAAAVGQSQALSAGAIDGAAIIASATVQPAAGQTVLEPIASAQALAVGLSTLTLSGQLLGIPVRPTPEPAAPSFAQGQQLGSAGQLLPAFLAEASLAGVEPFGPASRRLVPAADPRRVLAAPRRRRLTPE